MCQSLMHMLIWFRRHPLYFQKLQIEFQFFDRLIDGIDICSVQIFMRYFIETKRGFHYILNRLKCSMKYQADWVRNGATAYGLDF